MDIPSQPTQGPRPRRADDAELAFDATRASRKPLEVERVERAGPTAKTEGTSRDQAPLDRVEFSTHGRLLARELEDPETKRRFEALMQLQLEGRLATPERIERAAQRILETGALEEPR